MALGHCPWPSFSGTRGSAASVWTVPKPLPALRKARLVDEEILMLHSTSDREVLEQLCDLNAVCSIGTLEAGMALNSLAEGRATVIEAHLQIDCGMGFGGFPAEEPEKIVSLIRNLPNVAVSGIYTQLASKHAMDVQLSAFQQAVDAIQAAGCETGIIHAAGSYAMLRSDLSHLDAVRQAPCCWAGAAVPGEMDCSPWAAVKAR